MYHSSLLSFSLPFPFLSLFYSFSTMDSTISQEKKRHFGTRVSSSHWLFFLFFLFFCGAQSSRTIFFFVGPENVPLATCCIHTLTPLCCRAICNEISLKPCAIYARNPPAKGPNEHIFGPHKTGFLPPANPIFICTRCLPLPPNPHPQ